MAEMSFPHLPPALIVQNLQEIIPHISFVETDFKNPQSHRIELAYSHILDYIINEDMSHLSKPQAAAFLSVKNPECIENFMPTLHFALAMQRLMSACQAQDFKLIDLQQPKPKRTRRFMSALINFARFKDCRLEGFEAIKQDIEMVQEQHAGWMKNINSLKERINQKNAAMAEDEACSNQIEAEFKEESQKLAANHRAKADEQKEISHIKTTISEKLVKQEQLKVSILNNREIENTLRTQVVQSPERMKADITRMQSAVLTHKQIKVDKTKRLQELQSQAEGGATKRESSEQSVALITSINMLIAKQKEAIGQVEQVRDQLQGQQGVLTDCNHKEGHFTRLRESKQEKLAKLQLQHQHGVTAWKENTERDERELDEWRQKQEMNYEQVKCFQEPMVLLQKQLADKENLHEDEMRSLKESYSNLLQTLDSYHNKIAMEWDANKPQNLFTTS